MSVTSRRVNESAPVKRGDPAAAGAPLRPQTPGAPRPRVAAAGARPRARSPGAGAALGYAAAALAVAAGWALTRSEELVDSGRGLGYGLGITGGLLMAILLLYPLRKRIKLLRVLGPTKHWFRMHMLFGVLGPILILYHCNFQLGAANSNVALFCTLLVAGSGLVGRYLYAKIHMGLYGERASIKSLVERARMTDADSAGVTALVPELIERMHGFSALVLTPPRGFAASILLPVKLAVLTRLWRRSLLRYARTELRKHARASKTVAAERKRLDRVITRFVDGHLKRVRRAAELGSYERLFGLWHVFHLPFFYMLVLTAVVHVVAVHMY